MNFEKNLPETVNIDGVEYPINTDFRTSIKFEMLVQRETDEVKLLLEMLHLYYGELIPGNVPVAIEKALWFYAGGELKAKSSDSKKETLYSFEYDGDYIYSAFLEQYGIDLTCAELHWWKFRALFLSLSDKTKLSEIIGYRSVQISGKMSKEEKEFYKKMKKIYALPKNQKEEERMNEIRERLRNGESIEEVFG